MDTSKHDFSALFSQLGLAADAASIRAFIASHRLAKGTAITDAAFWTPAQAAFLLEGQDSDDDWTEVIDALAVQLTD
ncbi:DUF2789 domain-containing protein [Chitinimonas sp.]|uniref:DUF2789 domain-containing protein n=1 Tax=Chitinimonas sp. TaxID=1934313 RepID=UPI0035B25DEE